MLFVMDIKTRRVHFAGCTMSPGEAWMTQVARELTNYEDGFLNGRRYLLMDRDTKFCNSFRQLLEFAGIRCRRLPKRSPNLNGYVACCTSFVRLGRTSGNRRRSDSFCPWLLAGGGLIEWIEQTFVFVIVKVAKQQSMTSPDLDGSCCHLELLRDFGEG